MYSNYETSDCYSQTEIHEIGSWCDNNIGTDYEINTFDDISYQLVIVDVTDKDIAQLMQLEDFYLRRRRSE